MPLSDLQKETIHHQLGRMINAGLPFDRALGSLLDQSLTKDERLWVESIRDGLKQSKSLADSMEATEATVGTTPLETTMIAAGERSGHLDEAFENLSSYFGLIHRTKRKIRSALIYPLLLLHLAILLPAIPKAILATNESGGIMSVVWNTLLLLVGFWIIVACLWFLGKRLVALGDRNPAIDGLLNRVPFLGKARRFLSMSRFCSVSRMQLLAGLLVSQGLRAAGLASGSGRIFHASNRAADRVEGGSNLSGSLTAESAFESEFRRGIATGEEVGGIDEEMGRWTQIYEERATAAAEAGAAWLPRIFYFIVVILVVWQLISMFKNFYIGPINEMLDMI